jgi:polysaccharide chain length determinant protein (PEP-CTERM system associated)
MNDDESGLIEKLPKIKYFALKLRWLIVLTAAFVALATMAIALRLPNRYESEAVLTVVQPQVSQAVVAPVGASTLSDAVTGMTREILSQNRLLAIINEFDLYPKVRKTATPQGLAQQMRKDLTIEIQEPTSTVKISFLTGSPQLAQGVVSRVTSLFIEENLKNKGNQVTRTANFLSDQLTEAKRRLDEQEKRLADFKRNNLGVLPDQQGGNLASLSDVRAQLTVLAASQRRAEDQRASLESIVSGNLARIESERNALLSRLTPRHPEVLKKDQEVARMRGLIDRLRAGTSVATSPATATSPEDFSITQLRNQIDANGLEIEGLAADERRLRAEQAQYQQRMNMSPLIEQQLAGLNRDYDLVKKDYAELVNKQLQSEHSASLEERQEGQTFRLVDPPTLPVLPSSPKRGLISLAGAGGGVAVGLALAFLFSLRSSAFHSEKELKHQFSLPLVVSVPVLFTAAEEQTRRRQLWAEWAAGAFVALVVCAAELFVFMQG